MKPRKVKRKDEEAPKQTRNAAKYADAGQMKTIFASQDFRRSDISNF